MLLLLKLFDEAAITDHQNVHCLTDFLFFQLTKKSHHLNTFVELSVDKDVQKSKVLPFFFLLHNFLSGLIAKQERRNVTDSLKCSSPKWRLWCRNVSHCCCCSGYKKKHFLSPFPQVVFASKDPVWEEGFTFFVHSANTQQLIVQVCIIMLHTTYRSTVCTMCNKGSIMKMKALIVPLNLYMSKCIKLL